MTSLRLIPWRGSLPLASFFGSIDPRSARIVPEKTRRPTQQTLPIAETPPVMSAARQVPRLSPGPSSLRAITTRSPAGVSALRRVVAASPAARILSLAVRVVDAAELGRAVMRAVAAAVFAAGLADVATTVVVRAAVAAVLDRRPVGGAGLGAGRAAAGVTAVTTGAAVARGRALLEVEVDAFIALLDRATAVLIARDLVLP